MSYEEPARPYRRAVPGAARPVWLPPLVLAFVQVAGSAVAGRHQSGRVHLDALGFVLLLAAPALLLLLRRRAPIAVAAGAGAVTLLYIALGYPFGPVFAGLVAAFFSAAAAGRRKGVLVVAGAVFAGYVLVGAWLYRWLPPSGDHRASWAAFSGIGAWLLAVLAAAELLRVRRERIARERSEREAAERRRADEERLRIARELHDVLAHSISLINVQAGVALALLDERPEQARTALTTIKAASKEALGEVRQVLSTLRAPGEAPRAPAPGLDRLPELVDQAGSAGLEARVVVEGHRFPMPPGADLAAFRIVQEALTNIVRHSGSRAARIRLTYRSGAVDVRVDDDGPATGGGAGGGNGLTGMRERAAALGGTLETGPRPGGGWRVSATLPITPAGRPVPGGPAAAAAPAPSPGPAPGGRGPAARVRAPVGAPTAVPEESRALLSRGPGDPGGATGPAATGERP